MCMIKRTRTRQEHFLTHHRQCYAMQWLSFGHNMLLTENLFFSFVGCEPVPPACAEEESSHRQLCEDESAALPGGQPELPAGLQEH